MEGFLGEIVGFVVMIVEAILSVIFNIMTLGGILR